MFHGLLGIESSVVALSAATAMMIFGKVNVEHIIVDAEWGTILFFVGLFIVVGGMVETGVIKKLNGNQIKMIAIIAMFMDHFATTFYPNYEKFWWLLLIHLIGRVAAPIMWFMVVEGYTHTHSLKKYLERLLIFSIIAHFAYNFCFGISLIPLKDSLLNQTSIIWPLFLSVIGLWVEDQDWKDAKKIGCILILCLLAFPSDWSCFPILCTNHIYKNQGNLKKQVLGMALYISMYVLVYCLCIDVVYGLLQFGIVLVYPIMSLYDGTRGKSTFMKWFFYWFYVGHLILCGLIRVMM